MGSRPCLRSMKFGMYSNGPGRYSAFIAIKSLNWVGTNSFMYFCIPRDSYWKIPTVSPFWNNSYVFSSSSGNRSGSNLVPVLCATRSTASLIMVKVFNPKKSIFRSPADSTTELSNWVTSRSASFAVVIGTWSVSGEGVIITPQAWIPVFRTLPSRILAWLMVSALKSLPSDTLISSSAMPISSLLSFCFLVLSSQPKSFASLVFGTSLAKRSASCNGRSNTRAASRMADFAAMVP